jgi:phosphoesterase RecJ-like protein
MNGGAEYKEALTETAAAIDGAERILIATHRNPDGDAIGSLLGMFHLIDGIGKIAVPFCPDGVPKKLQFLPGAARVVDKVDGERFDATILLDTPSPGLILAGFPLPRHRGVFVIIDHHMRYDVMGDVVLRMKASAVGEILYRLAASSKWEVSRDAAECLYTAIVSDTASFRYESATPASHRVAADLLAKGVDSWRVATHLFESFSLSRQKLLAEVLATLKVSLEGRFASLYCTREMIQEAGASNGDLDGMVNNARAIDGVDLAAFLRETPEGMIRVSIRSKGEVDASQIAARLGGGGHVNAGGAYLKDLSLDDAVRLVETETAAVLPSRV